MPTYLITNRLPGGFAGSADAFAARTAWFERPGDNLAGRGDPAFTRTTVGNCGPGTVLDGSTLVTTGRLGEPAAPAAGHPLGRLPRPRPSAGVPRRRHRGGRTRAAEQGPPPRHRTRRPVSQAAREALRR